MYFCNMDPKTATSTEVKSITARRKHLFTKPRIHGKELFEMHGIYGSLRDANGIGLSKGGNQQSRTSLEEMLYSFDWSNNAKDTSDSGSDSETEFNFVQCEPGEIENSDRGHDSAHESGKEGENEEDKADMEVDDRVDNFETISSCNIPASFEKPKRGVAEEEELEDEDRNAVEITNISKEFVSIEQSKSKNKVKKKTSFIQKGLSMVSSYDITKHPNDLLPSVNLVSNLIKQSTMESNSLNQFPFIDTVVRGDRGVVPNKRRLTRPGPFLPYIRPEDYKAMPLPSQLPTFIGCPFPQPWGVPTRRGKKDMGTNKYPIPELTYPYTFLSQTLFKHYEHCGDKYRIK